MLEFQIEGQKLYIKKGTTMQLEMNNSIFNTDNIEGDVIFTFDVPAEPNDLIFEHARYVYVKRKRKYKAFVSVSGVVIAEGDLYLQKSTKLSYSCGIVVNPYPLGFADRELKDNDFDDDIIISESYAEHKSKFLKFLKKSTESDSIIRFPLFRDDSFYGSSNEDYGYFEGRIAGVIEHNKLINRLFLDGNNQVLEAYSDGIRVFNSMSDDPLNNDMDWNSFAFAPALSLLWLINNSISNAGYNLTGNFKDDYNVKKMIYQSMRAFDISASHFFKFNSFLYTSVNQQLDTWNTVNLTGLLELSKLNVFDKENTNMWDDASNTLTITKAGNYYFTVKIKTLITKQAYGEASYSDASRYYVFFSCNFLDENGNVNFNNFISGYPYPEWINPNCIYSEVYHTFGGNDELELTDLDQDENGHRIGEFEFIFQHTFSEADIGKKIRFFWGYQMIYYDSNNDIGTFQVYACQSQSHVAVLIYNQNIEGGFFDMSNMTEVELVSNAMLRNGKFNIFSNYFRYSEHVPSMTNSELINSICNLFGLNYYIDSKKKQIELSFFKDTLAMQKMLDLSKFVLTKETCIDEKDEKQYNYTLEPVENKDISDLKKIDDVNQYSDILYPEFNVGKYCFVKTENRYNLSEQSDEDWSIYWAQDAGNDNVLVCGENEDTVEIKPSLKVPGNDRFFGYRNNNFPSIDLRGGSPIFDTENNDFPLILLNHLGLHDFGNNIRYVKASPVCYNDDGNRERGIDITATGECSVGEVYAKPWLNFLATCEYVVYKLLVPLSAFLELVSLLKPQGIESENQIRWVLIDGIRLLPVSMTFEFTEGKETIKAEIKFAKEKISL